MAKYCGLIGYAVSVEESPGVWVDDIVERKYYGDVTRSVRRNEITDGVNDNINISNDISIVADPYAYDNYGSIVYATVRGVKWKVTSIEEQRPRLLLTLGGKYNGQ